MKPAASAFGLGTISLVSIYLAITGVFEIVGPHSLVWPRYIMDESIGILCSSPSA